MDEQILKEEDYFLFHKKLGDMVSTHYPEIKKMEVLALLTQEMMSLFFDSREEIKNFNSFIDGLKTIYADYCESVKEQNEKK